MASLEESETRMLLEEENKIEQEEKARRGEVSATIQPQPDPRGSSEVLMTSQGHLHLSKRVFCILTSVTGHGGDGSDVMSQAFPYETALSVKGNSPAKDIAVNCQQPTLPAVREGCPTWAKGSGLGHPKHLL